MEIILAFFRGNKNLYSYILYIVALLLFASVARLVNYGIISYLEKNPYARRGIAKNFTPFLILSFLIAGESFSTLLFTLTKNAEKSFSFFLNTQIIWGFFWLVMGIIKFGISKIQSPRINLKNFFPAVKIILLLILLTTTITRNYQRIISSLLGFGTTYLLLRISYAIEHIPLTWTKTSIKEKPEKIVARWDSFLITLPYNTQKEVIDKAIEFAKKCVKETDNTRNRSTVLLKDLSERGIVIEVKYLVRDSIKIKETRHDLLSRILKVFADEEIPMSQA